MNYPVPLARNRSHHRASPRPVGNPIAGRSEQSLVRGPKRLRTRLYLYYASLFTVVLLMTAIMAQYAIASVAERSASAALKSSAAAFDRVVQDRRQDGAIAAADIRMIERMSAIDLSAVPLIQDAHGNWRSGHTDNYAGALVPARMVQRAIATDTSEPVTLALAAGPSIALIKPLQDGALLLSYPLKAAMEPFRTIQIALMAAGLAGLLLMLVGSWAIAHQISQPISALDNAVRRLKAGEPAQVTTRTNDEIGRLGESFNAMARLAHLAFHDALTGLPNRTLFHETLVRTLKSGNRVALLCVDLDGFKLVNDTLGHAAGDEVLKIAAKRMAKMAPGAMVARLGGDEFAIILPDVIRHSCEWTAARLVDTLSQPMSIEGSSTRIGASIGIAEPETDVDSDELVRRADCALYSAKQAGKNTYRHYDELRLPG